MLRKGGSFQRLADLLLIVFINKEDAIHKVYRSFKVHVQIEEAQNSKAPPQSNGWLSKANNANSNAKAAKIINYWCFNPGFGYLFDFVTSLNEIHKKIITNILEWNNC